MTHTIALIGSQGGHAGQLKLIFTSKVLGKHKAIFITEDTKPKIVESYFLKKHRTYFFRKDYLAMYPQRYFSTFLKLRKIFQKEKITFIITNGAQISLPAVLAAKSLDIPSLFIDTVIRVKTPNWSAKACYPLVDIFLVQHQSMIKKYGKKAQYRGGIL